MTLLVQFNSLMYSLTSDQNKTLLQIMIHDKAVMPFWGGGGGTKRSPPLRLEGVHSRMEIV